MGQELHKGNQSSSARKLAMSRYTVAVIADEGHDIDLIDEKVFIVIRLSDSNSILNYKNYNEIDLAVIDHKTSPSTDSEFYQQAKMVLEKHSIPAIILTPATDLDSKIKAFDAGYVDAISIDEPVNEITTRLMREIFHRIADQQLKQQVDQASSTAFSAMKESHNLGNNIQCLLKINQSTNLDQIGQVMFQTLQQYGILCSLQIRSVFGVKNMEANGMEKPLESAILTKLKDIGRYYDFGKRCVVNYGCVSLLIKNMPEDEMQFGLIKDNTFCLLQGMDCKVRALDEHEKLEQEKKSLKHLSLNVAHVMKDIEQDYHSVMQQILTVVESMASKIEAAIPNLMLSEDQEKFIESTINQCVFDANEVFGRGLKVDDHFKEILTNIEKISASIEEGKDQLPDFPAEDTSLNTESHDNIELF